MALQYPRKLQLAQLPTPLQLLERLSAEVGGPRIWIKRDDLTGCALSGNKVRKLEFSLAQAQAERATVVITCGGLQSNHCRATAVAAAQLGMKAHLVLRGEKPDVPDGNLFLDQVVGAEISFHTLDEFSKLRAANFETIAESYRQRGEKPFLIPMGASDEIGAWGYIAAAGELKQDCERAGFTPDHVVTATGSGGTQAGLTAGNTIHGLGSKVWGVCVCDNETYFKNKVRSDLDGWKERYKTSIHIPDEEIRVIDGYVGPGYAKATPEIFDLIRRVATLEGVILDPVYTGKAFNGMLHELCDGKLKGAEDIVFIHTGGIYGLMAQRKMMV